MLHVVYVKKGYILIIHTSLLYLKDIFYLSLSTFWMQCNFIEIICLVFFFLSFVFFLLKKIIDTITSSISTWDYHLIKNHFWIIFSKEFNIYAFITLKTPHSGNKFQTSIFRKNTCIQSIKRNTFNSFSCFDKIKLFFSRWDSL